MTSSGNQPLEEITEIREDPSYWNYISSNNLPPHGNTFLYLVVTAVTVLVFTLGHNVIEVSKIIINLI